MATRRKAPLAYLHVDRSDQSRDRIADAILRGFEHSPEANLDSLAAGCTDHDAELLETWLGGFIDLLDLPAGDSKLLLVQQSKKKLPASGTSAASDKARQSFQRALGRQLKKTRQPYRLHLRLLSHEGDTPEQRAQVAAALRFAAKQLPSPERPVKEDGEFELCRVWLGGEAATRVQLYLGWRGKAPGDWQVAVWSEHGQLLAVAQTRVARRRLEDESPMVQALLEL